VNAPAAAVLAIARPGNQEVAGEPVDRDGGVGLVADGGEVDAELAALRPARGIVHLRLDAPAAAVLAIARPGDDEIAAEPVHRHGGGGLIAGGGGVDAELAPLGRARAAVELPEDAQAAAVLAIARPGDDEIARVVHGD